MKRRAFLQLVAAAPIAALLPWRPARFAGVDLASGPDYLAIVELRNRAIARVLCPPIVMDAKAGTWRYVEPSRALLGHLAMLELPPSKT